MLAFAAQLGFIRCLFAVFAAVFAVGAVFRDETLAGRMRALVGISHCVLLLLVAVSTGRPLLGHAVWRRLTLCGRPPGLLASFDLSSAPGPF